jgi:hypothetical protein
MTRLKNTFWMTSMVTEEIKEEIKKFPGANGKENTTYQNL